MPESGDSVFIAGSNGQLGHDLQLLLSPRYSVTAADLPDLDITNPDSISRVLDPAAPGTIINAAAYTQVDRCETDRETARQVNAQGPYLLATYAATYQRRLVHISTDYVFDGTRAVPQSYRETDEPAPVTAYGQTKLAGEEAVRTATDNHVILRTAWLYGINGNNFLKTMLRLALQDPARIVKVVNDQHGCPTWSFRLAQQIEALLATDAAGTFHATGEGHCTWYELARTFLQAMDVPFAL
ncbi:MAG: dTDP-4-dehydrorhamnose reductase, partial [Verrucomicrobia bacterium]|nr:dTDP-4-dehydrorhamnose reductase [Verrucomicrobiota bacterium]